MAFGFRQFIQYACLLIVFILIAEGASGFSAETTGLFSTDGTSRQEVDNTAKTYTSEGSVYAVWGNPNLVNYAYTTRDNDNDLELLLSICTELIKSDRVTEQMAERLKEQGYNGLSIDYIKKAVTKIESVNETPIIRICCSTTDPKLSRDICQVILDIAVETFEEYGINIIMLDAASLPTRAD